MKIRLNYFLWLLLIAISSCISNEKADQNRRTEQQTHVEFARYIPIEIQPYLLKNSYDSAYINDSNLIVDASTYENLIVQAMGLTTTLIKKNSNEFYLLYNYSTSSTKMKQIFKFVHRKGQFYLTVKEVQKWGKEGVSIHRMYLKNCLMGESTYSDLESIGSSIEDLYVPFENICSIQLFDHQEKKIGTIKTNVNVEDILFENSVFEEDQSRINKLVITKIEEWNNAAFYLDQNGDHLEAIFLLKEVIAQFPNRTVAYLNLADAYWALNENQKASNNYKKYQELMKTQGKDLTKIPARVHDRLKNN